MTTVQLWIPDQVRDDDGKGDNVHLPPHSGHSPSDGDLNVAARMPLAEKPLSYNIPPCFKMVDELPLPAPARHPPPATLGAAAGWVAIGLNFPEL
jgi:hypothetical protein